LVGIFPDAGDLLFDGKLLLLFDPDGLTEEFYPGEACAEVVVYVGGNSCSFFFDGLFLLQQGALYFQAATDIASDGQHDNSSERKDQCHAEPPGLPPGRMYKKWIGGCLFGIAAGGELGPYP